MIRYVTWVVLIGLIISPVLGSDAFAQSVPPPPPAKSDGDSDLLKLFFDEILRVFFGTEGSGPSRQLQDSEPPKIEPITTELREGMNVVKIKITDDTGISSRSVKYVQDGQIVQGALAKESPIVYKTLVDAKKPSMVISFYATDVTGKSSELATVYEVRDSSPFFLEEMAQRIGEMAQRIGLG